LVAEIDWQPNITADTVVPEDESSDEDIGPGDTVIELRPDNDGSLIPYLCAEGAADPPSTADPDEE